MVYTPRKNTYVDVRDTGCGPRMRREMRFLCSILVSVRGRNAKETCVACVLHNLFSRECTIVHTEAFEFGVQVLMVPLMGGAANEKTRRQRLLGGQIRKVVACA